MASVHVSAVIRAPIAQVWSVIRDFNALPHWHPMMSTSRIEEGLGGTSVGCIRNFQLKDGGATLRERLLTLSDLQHSVTYEMLDSPMAVSNYVATLRLLPITTTNHTLGDWQASFTAPPDQEREIVALVERVFAEGLQHVDRLLTPAAT